MNANLCETCAYKKECKHSTLIVGKTTICSNYKTDTTLLIIKIKEHLYKRLTETALNNVNISVNDISEIYMDIAENRLNIWIDEIIRGEI